VAFATEDGHLGDDALYAYAGRIAMGAAVLRSGHLLAPVEQVALWDGGPAGGPSGTTVDVEAWRATGRPQTIIPLDAGTRSGPTASPTPGLAVRRRPHAMLFGDFAGFSRLGDAQLPGFVRDVLGAVAGVTARHRDEIRFLNTWGDGLYIVLEEAAAAARCALDLQAAVQALDLAALGLPETLALRLGGHLGPVYEDRDPVLDRANYFGAHVSRAARVEPATPPGCVYVTDPLAAALALAHDQEFACDYVGMTEAAKKYGAMPMFLLRRREGG
jgi:class 3 adenylate cyclase